MKTAIYRYFNVYQSKWSIFPHFIKILRNSLINNSLRSFRSKATFFSLSFFRMLMDFYYSNRSKQYVTETTKNIEILQWSEITIKGSELFVILTYFGNVCGFSVSEQAKWQCLLNIVINNNRKTHHTHKIQKKSWEKKTHRIHAISNKKWNNVAWLAGICHRIISIQ